MSNLITLSTQTRACVPGAGLRLLVLDAGPTECAAIDLDSGAFVRGHWPVPDPAPTQSGSPGREEELVQHPVLRPYCSAKAVIGIDDAPPDPSRPEAVPFAGPPEPGRPLPHRKLRGYLEAMIAPTRMPLLGFLGPSIRFWQMSGTHPSLSLIRPTQGPQLLIDHGEVKARFEWDGLQHCLEVSNQLLCSAALAAGAPRLSGDALAAVLGYRPRYMLIALTRPRDGYCHKTVGAILPRP